MQSVGIAGFRGYSGAELLRILRRHPGVTPVLLEHRQDFAEPTQPLNQRPVRRISCTLDAVRNEKIALVFLATPAEVSMELAPEMLAAGAKVVDLSGAFRLRTVENYRRWYKEEHRQPGLLAEAMYGLPEFCRAGIPQARLISNPGCYPTAANLAL